MWHIKSIQAKNLCSFLDMEYTIKQGAATLIFGNNLDSDSQNSNGSGKSALIEAISIALTGEPLRKVNTDEIINDTKDEAIVAATLVNETTGEAMHINRQLSRKSPQQISITLNDEEVAQASVSDYNKYILDQLGLAKDDIFANFILTARKYKSFLASTDKEKKEIINRFSNGVLVDDSIEQLQSDIAPVQEELNEADKLVATCVGRVEAMGAEIEKAINDSKTQQADNEDKIQRWTESIAKNRTEIRNISEQIASLEEASIRLANVDKELQEIEDSTEDIATILSKVEKALSNAELNLRVDYANKMQLLSESLEKENNRAKELSEAATQYSQSLALDEAAYTKEIKELDVKVSNNERSQQDCAQKIQQLLSEIKRINNYIDQLNVSARNCKAEEAKIKNQLAGVIACPKCKYEFVLDSTIDVEVARQCLKEIEASYDLIAKEIEGAEKEYNATVEQGKAQREVEASIEKERTAIKQQIQEANNLIESKRRELEGFAKQLDNAQANISDIQNKIARIKTQLFEEAYNLVDAGNRTTSRNIKSLTEQKSVCEGSISSYEKAIEEAKNVKQENILDSLKESQKQYIEDHKNALQKRTEIEGRLNELKTQEQTFVEFKTYLANTKINAISQITNEFLETIGSDIRVALSGYTVLKSGKVRDKISVSLLRDGVDCGSFEKFSAGERVRVELASILSMNKLMNMNCEEGKGLDLLIADEVLDSADEQGLASVFKALNQTQLTSLIVSHGSVQESYPNRITITKSNGISFISNQNDTTKIKSQ